jgi:hypothetical protein
MEGDRGPSPSWYDELRLNAGLFDLEDAGDCCEGGVYGISPTRVLEGRRLVGDSLTPCQTLKRSAHKY